MKHKKKRQNDPSDGERRSKGEPASPKNFKEHLLAIPQDGGEFERIEIGFREVDFRKE